MPLTLHVDADRWRDHLKSFAAAHPGLVPVAKGNGYGFGTETLAGEAAALGVD
ncbi:MAG TPA: alanine racemase, partial [Microlunatus sp.]|nr:alanine racemase [Microlunatus sp.]